jgi:excisionase family DNA binding protein
MAAPAAGVNGGPRLTIHEQIDQLFTLREAAGRMRCGESTLRREARLKRIGHLRVGRRLLFSAHDISEYMATRRVEVVP